MSHGHDDYAVEPIRGLPGHLPAGEHILWQGEPQWWEIAKRVFHIRAAAIYFVLLMAWRTAPELADGQIGAAALVAASLLPITVLGLALLALLAKLCARTTVYTITNKRIVLRIGVALPTAINLPFRVIGAAGLRTDSSGSGDIYLSINDAKRMAYSNLWPHVRPWKLAHPQPMLRGLKDVQNVAALLGQALVNELPANAAVLTPLGTVSGKSPIAYSDAQSAAGLSTAGQIA